MITPGETGRKDLVVLVADKNMEYALRGLLEDRTPALGIRQLTYDIYSHPRHDPGCLNEAHEYLGGLLHQYRHALVLFDKEGCGQEHQNAQMLEKEVNSRLSGSGWDEYAAVIVLDPELEVWVWSESPHVAQCLGWAGNEPSLGEWLVSEGWLPEGEHKPPRPKEALEAALRESRRPRSSAIYQYLARRVSLAGHTERAFVCLVKTLQRWFGTCTM